MRGPRHIRPGEPLRSGERHIILDALRGLALWGICLANFPEFSLYTFLPGEAAAAMPTAGIDRTVRFLQNLFIDGKFYTLFSLLFGIGFSIILSNAQRKQADGMRIFYRRMGILLLIGLAHLMFLWSGDILMLYALAGLFLPFFRKMSDRRLLRVAAVLLLLPVAIDAAVALSGVYPSAAVVEIQQYFCARYGITTDNFAYWLRDAQNYGDIFRFLVQGAFVRIQEFIDGNRLFKVMGLFLLGYYVGRNRLYALSASSVLLLKRVCCYGFGMGFPLSVLYAWSSLNAHPWGLAVHSVLYATSVFPMGLAYAAAFSLWYLHRKEAAVFRLLAAPGRMALTNYIGQSVWGMLLFYGTGFRLGAGMGLVYVVLTATGVYGIEVVFSQLWLRYFRFGPLEWLWRMLTYGTCLSLRKN